MVDENRESQRRGDGRPQRRGAPRNDSRGMRPPQPRPQSGLPASEYAGHLENEHNLKVVEEAGWPTEIKRYSLVRSTGDKKPDKVLATFEGTRPQAISHFYGYLHPRGDHRQVQTPSTQEVPETGPASSVEAA